jgi:hypothetical protein
MTLFQDLKAKEQKMEEYASASRREKVLVKVQNKILPAFNVP